MYVTSIHAPSKKDSPTSKIIYYVLLGLGLAAVLYFGWLFISRFVLNRGVATISATLTHGGNAELFINDSLVGALPVESHEVVPGEKTLVVKDASRSFTAKVPFMNGAEVQVKRDLGVSDLFSSGSVFWISKSATGSTFSLVSEPSGASVLLDGVIIGKTPFSTEVISSGIYDLRVEAAGYEAISEKIEISSGLMLNGLVRLYPLVAPSSIALLEGSEVLYDVYVDNPAVTSDTASWVLGLIHWLNTRKAGIEFEYFLDEAGNVFDSKGALVSTENFSVASGAKGAYLRTSIDAVLSSKAREAFLEVLGQAAPSAATPQAPAATQLKATVLDTGVGWLRVRSAPNLSGAEVTRVNVGQTFDVLERNSEWVKIKVSETVSGWVSATYVSVK